MRIFDETLRTVERSLDVRLQRHNVLAGNIANIDTPGYRPKDVDFVAAMGAAMGGGGEVARTDSQHFDASGGGVGSPVGGGGETAAPIIDAVGTTPTLDGNQVDLDRTMADLAQNGMQYNAGARAAQKKLAILRYAASDGVG